MLLVTRYDWLLLITHITLLTSINFKRKIFWWSPTVFRFAFLYDCILIYKLSSFFFSYYPVTWEGRDLISCSCQCHVHHRKNCPIYIAPVSLVHLTSSEILACSDWSRSPADGMRTQVVQCWKAVPFVRVLDVRNSPYFLERLEKKNRSVSSGISCGYDFQCHHFVRAQNKAITSPTWFRPMIRLIVTPRDYHLAHSLKGNLLSITGKVESW